MNAVLWIPLACGFAFPAMAWLSKRSMREAGDAWGTLFIANAAMALVFVPPFLWSGADFSPGPLWQPFLCGTLFFVGQVAAYKSFETGDIGVAVPVQGTKALLVALIASLFFAQPAGWNIWAAALLTPVALFFLREHAPGKRESRRHWRTVALGSAAAAAFAALDAGIGAWSKAWGVWRFGFWTFGFQGVLSLLLLVLPGRARRFRYAASTWIKLGAGAAGMALITFGLTWAISVSGRAAWANILFNSRLLWSIAFVWACAKWLGEAGDGEGRGAGGKNLLRSRLVGAAFMMATLLLAAW
jgi:hypothetical protein